MKFNVEVKYFLKTGMLNPEASTIEKSLDLLGYKVENTKTLDIIEFQIKGDSEEEIKENVKDMCERLLCNPVIHNYEITVTSA